MQMTTIGNTNLNVSKLCLGTVNYGTKTEEARARRQLDYFVDRGGNFIDTARIYGDWIPGTRGLSEKVVGKWIRDKQNRESIVIATKGAHPNIETMHIPRVNTDALEQDIKESLSHLQTDYIDLYFLHRDDPKMPVAELIDWLEEKKSQGYIRAYGFSNWTVARLYEAEEYVNKKSYKGFASNQMLASLADVNPKWCAQGQLVAMTKAFEEFHLKTNKNLMAYMSLSNGWFLKQFVKASITEDIAMRYQSESNVRMLEMLQKHCNSEQEILAYCYQFILEREYSSVAIASFGAQEQLEASLACLEQAQINPEVLQMLRELKKQD
jgi:Predicted oxidoreductases (related to aryl-alcohol dehydrogenases)